MRDLFLLTFCPTRLQKLSNTSIMASQFFELAFANNIRLSAKKIWEKLGPFLDALTLSHLFSLHILEIWAPKNSIQRRKRSRDKGSPCLIPFKGWKGSSLLPLNTIVVDVEDTQLMINLIMFGEGWSVQAPFLRNSTLCGHRFFPSLS